MSVIQELVPRQKKGSETGATTKKRLSSRYAAKALFSDAKARLLAINNWYALCGNTGAEFRLTDEHGNFIHTAPEVGNLIRINLPAPPNATGDGYDWVRIEKFDQQKELLTDEELFGFRVRPVSNPRNRVDDSAHFYTSDATSTFLVYRKSLVVHAMERGRNEVPNPAGSILNRIRNSIIAFFAMRGLAVPQWKKLVNGILEPPDKN